MNTQDPVAVTAAPAAAPTAATPPVAAVVIPLTAARQRTAVKLETPDAETVVTYAWNADLTELLGEVKESGSELHAAIVEYMHSAIDGAVKTGFTLGLNIGSQR